MRHNDELSLPQVVGLLLFLGSPNYEASKRIGRQHGVSW